MPRPKPTHCKECGVNLDTDPVWHGEFRHNRCRNCYNKHHRDLHDPIKHKNNQLKSKFGIGLDKYNEMFAHQQGACAICRKSFDKALHVDHDHKTGKVRGLLCNHCNTAIGYLKEDEEIIWNMMEYLKEHKWSKSDDKTVGSTGYDRH